MGREWGCWEFPLGGDQMISPGLSQSTGLISPNDYLGASTIFSNCSQSKIPHVPALSWRRRAPLACCEAALKLCSCQLKVFQLISDMPGSVADPSCGNICRFLTSGFPQQELNGKPNPELLAWAAGWDSSYSDLTSLYVTQRLGTRRCGPLPGQIPQVKSPYSWLRRWLKHPVAFYLNHLPWISLHFQNQSQMFKCSGALSISSLLEGLWHRSERLSTSEEARFTARGTLHCW